VHRGRRPRLRACYPADICSLVHAIGEYEGRELGIDHASIDRAVALYFAKSPAPGSQPGRIS